MPIKPSSQKTKTPIDYAVDHAHSLSKYIAFHTSYLHNTNESRLSCICTMCKATFHATLADSAFYNESQVWDQMVYYSQKIMEFAEQHKHEKPHAWEQQSLQSPLLAANQLAQSTSGGLGSFSSGGMLGSTSNPLIEQYADYTTMADVQSDVVKQNTLSLYAPFYAPMEANEAQNALNAQMNTQLDIINASLQVVPSGHKIDSVFVDQSVAKEIAKLSDFNVDIQGKVHAKTVVSQYRALCSKCQASHPVTKQELTTMSEDLREFCREHSHKTEVAEPKTGRKFKEE